MPKSTAIQLTKENIPLISHELNVDEKEIAQEYVDSVLLRPGGEPVYYVTNAQLFTARVPYMIYGRGEFLDEFESVPPGIQYHFVIVKQISSRP